jgi:transcriptional regulator with XRE-family HTH domain
VREKRQGKHPKVGPKEFPLTLRAWRKQKKLKVASAASACGVSASTWTHWETGHRFPTGSHLLVLSSFTGIALACLVCEKRPACAERRGMLPPDSPPRDFLVT